MSVEKMDTKIIQPPKEKIAQPQKMGLLVENPVYKPFRYPWCYDAWLTQQRIHWCLLGGLGEHSAARSESRSNLADHL